jgi:hypothetical protein
LAVNIVAMCARWRVGWPQTATATTATTTRGTVGWRTLATATTATTAITATTTSGNANTAMYTYVV